MIPVLLWRCPICGTDDALRQRRGWWKPDRLWCVNCHVTWEVRRVIYGDYQLRVIEGEASLLGEEAPLAQWYDRMKAGLKLVPLQDPSMDLEKDEVLWVRSKRVKLLQEVPVSVESPGLYFRNRKVGTGQLFLTSERLIWRDGGRLHPFWLRRLNAVWTVVDVRLVIQYDVSEVFKFRFLEESLLKWLTYIALAARRIEEVYGHKIALSTY